MGELLMMLRREMPPGWECRLTHAGDGFTVTCIGWSPHRPETTAEYQYCRRFEISQRIGFKELEQSKFDVALHVTDRAVRALKLAVEKSGVNDDEV